MESDFKLTHYRIILPGISNFQEHGNPTMEVEWKLPPRLPIATR